MAIKWWGDKREWGLICGTKEADISSVKIFDGFGRKSNKFKVNDKIIVKAEFNVHDEVREPHFGVAIFRDDGVYCYGPNTHFDGYRIEKLPKGKGWFSIEYEKIPLMPGKYFLSVGIWDKNEILPYSFHITRYSFIIKGLNKNRQLLFIPHSWDNGKLADLFTLKELAPIGLNSLQKKQQHKNSHKNSNNIDIDSIQLMNSASNVQNDFITNEPMRITIKIVGEVQYNYLIWVGIFRADDIYCHGVAKKLAKNEKIISLIYQQLSLLPGEYYLSAGIWQENQKEPLLYKHKANVFKTSFLTQDHGTVYVKHYWSWKLLNDN